MRSPRVYIVRVEFNGGKGNSFLYIDVAVLHVFILYSNFSLIHVIHKILFILSLTQSGNIGVFLSLFNFCTLLLKTGIFASTLHHRYLASEKKINDKRYIRT